jgi:hypothetical protein
MPQSSVWRILRKRLRAKEYRLQTQKVKIQQIEEILMLKKLHFLPHSMQRIVQEAYVEST